MKKNSEESQNCQKKFVEFNFIISKLDKLVVLLFINNNSWLVNPNFIQFGLLHIFLLNGPNKKTKQNSSKKKQHLQQQEAKSARQQTVAATKTFFGMLSQELCIDWLVCIAYCFFWYLIGSDQLSYFS